MALSDFAVVILAAGKGTRLKSSLAKVLHRAGGRTLIEHVVRACQPLKLPTIVAVVGHQAAEVSAILKPLGVQATIQNPQRGTGHAVLIARRVLGSRAKYAIVLPGDAPLVRSETLAELAKLHQQSGAAATILSAQLADPGSYGRIVRREDGTVEAIVEDSALTADQRAINEINSSIYAFTLEKLWPCLGRLRPNNKHRELYLTDAIALLRTQGEAVHAIVAADADEVLGCNTRADLAGVDLAFRRRKRAELMSDGVSMLMPESILIDADVTVGPDTLLEPGVQLLGRTRIGTGCTIHTGSILTDVTAEDGVLIKPYSILNSSYLSAEAQVGPFSHFRSDVRLLRGARVGNFVEVKKSTLAEGVKAMHLTYLGDARIGAETNVGAGTITCNYDGLNKNPTTIGRRVFIGSDTALVAPVKVGDGAYIGAGSTITDNVPADALAIARGRQVNKPGWATARRRQMNAAAKQKTGHKTNRGVSQKARPRRRIRSARVSKGKAAAAAKRADKPLSRR
ncbi:MAG TPA: bifunctional UDP-N-acetylglucosamine diphosphorylase/glucosamine-1-phosphate N-acetyltransferase GlmU [Candidatus Acidoferrales bacterium]|jgi:bifunctional UDP-N-acetylglucosamine pyrophosphorylase/glucosamine-1-phosphate N-acetyltransferase|nr:bifunctional UDP-N-acetylglucosamine diphosphorylase/glucosamine-1-phosphate N-acetyltransferase GlmU [Candidatus Acidoferrales bacterium]